MSGESGGGRKRRTDLLRQDGLLTMSMGVAHDFNNSLAAIIGNANVALARMPKRSPFRESIQQIQNAAYRALDLTDRILIFTGRAPFNAVQVHLSVFVENLVETLRGLLPPDVRLVLRLARDLPLARCDERQLRETIVSLMANAADAMADRKGAVTLTTALVDCTKPMLRHCLLGGALPPGPYAMLEVRDQGCGITPLARRRMFDPFFSTKLRGQGLGLAVAVGAMRAHGGAMRVLSRPGRGSTVRIYLPCGDPGGREKGDVL